MSPTPTRPPSRKPTAHPAPRPAPARNGDQPKRFRIPWGLVAWLALGILLGILVWWRWHPIPAPRIAREEFARKQTLAEGNLVYAGLPKLTASATPLLILRNRGYSVGYSESRENPLWAAYRLDPIKQRQSLPRPGGFKIDPRTRARVPSKLYQKTGYDRGHLAPNAAIAQRFGEEAQLETFLMSNIAPQRPNLNRRVFERLERKEEEYADRFGPIWVIAGPVFDARRETLADGEVEIPDAFFKILVDEDNDKIRLLPFLFPQEVQGNEPLQAFLDSVDDIEKQTGLDFLWAISDTNENKLEAFTPKHLW